MEIPKDGKAYLAWHNDYGIVSVKIIVHPPGTLSVKSCDCVYITNLHELECSGNLEELKNITRWMDETGQWHEVKHD